ncbi:uncharacterized protein LOC128736792 [Sabethes cyaneus]|uniref:uncharacterized protein LOC128736792 n=1 Tax=Sabethes cyaneus TaxID=53552 RepID=UPI00237E8479|nr:uncharacterized protein LOC128736792 [Sabethes cyaneus]
MEVLTAEKLNSVLIECGFRESEWHMSNQVVDQMNTLTDSRREAAMFLAQLIYESAGFHNLEEPKSKYHPEYVKYFHGRGYIKLRGQQNYEDATIEIFKDDTLLRDPDRASSAPWMAMRVSVYYWKKFVRPDAGSFDDFYATTKVLNGEVETSPDHPNAKKRHEFYVKAANVLDPNANPPV